jgi:hypothetical protein
VALLDSFDGILGRFRHQSSGGLLGGLGQGGGILSTQTGILQARIATLKAGGSLQAKVQALTGTLGQRLKTPGGLLSGLGGGGTPAASTDARYAAEAQVRASLLPSPSQARWK